MMTDALVTSLMKNKHEFLLVYVAETAECCYSALWQHVFDIDWRDNSTQMTEKFILRL